MINDLTSSAGPGDHLPGIERKRFPFTVSMIDGDTHLCALCLFKHKYVTETK